MKKTTLLLLLSCCFACKVNQYTGKKTLNFFNNKQVFPIAFKEYNSFIAKNPPVKNTIESEKIKRIGEKITAAAQAYFSHKGTPEFLKDYAWEYNVIESEQKNAWCMPGGKIVFYTGILPIAKTPDGIAAIMGHEVAHALADHGAQRMSVNVLKKGVDFIALKSTEKQPKDKRERILTAYGYGSQLGVLLPFSRKHEIEADKIGLELMTIAGYDPKEAANVWRRMQANATGKKVPEILSTHPSSERRIKQLEAHIPHAIARAKELEK
ncbi:MAG: M48 family metallopeptidase [Flavobacteriaceae bacterium]